jgi:hypothetical protein
MLDIYYLRFKFVVVGTTNLVHFLTKIVVVTTTIQKRRE